MPSKNAPGPKAEGVVCLLGGNTDAYSTARAQVQHLVVQPALPGPIIRLHLGDLQTELSWGLAA